MAIEIVTHIPPTKRKNAALPPLESMISVHDFEEIARKTFIEKTFAFYSAAATDLVTARENVDVWRKLLLRPRVLRNVKDVVTKRRIMGCESSVPFFVCPAAMAGLAHADGELAVARGCGSQAIIQTVSSNASYPLSDVVYAGCPGQPFFFQLYVNSNRDKTEEIVRKAKALGVKALVVTVDAPVPGKREADERIKADNIVSPINGAVAASDTKGGGLGRIVGRYIDPTLNWDDIKWLRDASQLPIILKGIQTAADAQRALDAKVDGILLSNHGGRSLDTVQPAIVTLLEIHKQCPQVLDKLEVYVDGGITRGADILKAVALGATAVGIAKPYLYSLAYGQQGVEHLTQILTDELVTAMKLSGVTDIDQAHPGLVNTSKVESMVWDSETHPWISWKPLAKL